MSFGTAHPVTYPLVAYRAGVSRTFLYENAEARALMTAATSRGRRRSAGHGRDEDASWRERALNAEEALKAAHAEIRTQRERIGLLLGQIRDLESDYAEDAIQQVAAEKHHA
jgi:hypothetical protein